MHFPQALTVLASVTLAVSIPNIHMGPFDACGTDKYGPDYFAWLEGEPLCSGNHIGYTNLPPGIAYTVCDKLQTIGSYSGVQFENCTSQPSASSGQVMYPTGVTIGGVHMVCESMSEADMTCPSPCGHPNPDVTVRPQIKCQVEEEAEKEEMEAGDDDEDEDDEDLE